jgi:hypothetical protein
VSGLPAITATSKGKVICTCGRIFRSEEAQRQHQSDSSRHPETRLRRTDGVKCSCGKIVKDENGLKEHMRASLRHRKLEEFCAAVSDDEDKSYFGFPDDGGVSHLSSYVAREGSDRSFTVQLLSTRHLTST